MGVAKDLVVRESFGESFNGGDAGETIRGVVAELGGTRHGHGPQAFATFIGPVWRSMNHHGSSLGDNDLNGIFSNSILPFSANAAEMNWLIFVGESLHEFS